MRTIGDRAEGQRLRVLIVLLWRAGLRISEALALQESDLDRSRGAVLVRRRREASAVGWTAGVGATRPVAGHPSPAPNRRGAMRDPRIDGRTSLAGVGRAQ